MAASAEAATATTRRRPRPFSSKKGMPKPIRLAEMEEENDEVGGGSSADRTSAASVGGRGGVPSSPSFPEIPSLDESHPLPPLPDLAASSATPTPSASSGKGVSIFSIAVDDNETTTTTKPILPDGGGILPPLTSPLSTTTTDAAVPGPSLSALPPMPESPASESTTVETPKKKKKKKKKPRRRRKKKPATSSSPVAVSASASAKKKTKKKKAKKGTSSSSSSSPLLPVTDAGVDLDAAFRAVPAGGGLASFPPPSSASSPGDEDDRGDAVGGPEGTAKTPEEWAAQERGVPAIVEAETEDDYDDGDDESSFANDERRAARRRRTASSPSVRFDVGVVGNLASGSVMATCGNTVVLSTVVHSSPSSSSSEKEAKDANDEDPLPALTRRLSSALRSNCRRHIGMTPLTVDHRRRHHGAGLIPKNASRKDNVGRPSDEEILAGRAVDRALRPLLPTASYGMEDDLALTSAVQSYDPSRKGEGGDSVATSVNAASAAIIAAKLPFEGSAAAAKVHWTSDGTLTTGGRTRYSRGEMLYAGCAKGCLMIECNANRSSLDDGDDNDDPGVPESVVADMIRTGHELIKPILESQERLKAKMEEEEKGGASDEDLAAELGLTRPIPADGTDGDHTDDETVLLDASSAAEAILDDAHNFASERLFDVALRLFGHDASSSFSSDASSSYSPSGASVHPADGPSLLSKTVRGRRETLVRDEVVRLLREEYRPSSVEDPTVREAYAALVDGDDPAIHDLASAVHSLLLRSAMGRAASVHRTRGDGRRPSSPSSSDPSRRIDATRTVRPIEAIVPALPDAVHGSALFRRGETEVLCTATLGAPREGRPVVDPYRPSLSTSKSSFDGEGEGTKKKKKKTKKGPFDDLPVGSLRYLRSQMAMESDYNSRKVTAMKERTGDSGTLDEVQRAFLQYDFPAYSTGEAPGKGGGTNANRRAIGHGALAERAVLPSLPSPDAFPYAIRLTAEVTSSNGSSSMASACGATLAMLDAGVPISHPVAGVSVGAVEREEREEKDEEGRSAYELLLDITGTEDHHGLMDFKVAGTRGGVTAMQLDVKKPLPLDVLIDALDVARDGRNVVLDEMSIRANATSGGSIGRDLSPRPTLKDSAPRVVVIEFDPLRKRDLIGPGGSVLRQLEDRFDVDLDLSQEGRCLLHGTDATAVSEAKAAIVDLVADVVEGGVYEGTVIEIKDFGAILELLRNKEGLLHVSELDGDGDGGDGGFHPGGNEGVVRDRLTVGERIEVLCTGVDPVQGSIKLSRKKLLEMRGGGRGGR